MCGIRNYAIEMELGAMMYIPSFIKIGSGIQNLIRGDIHTGTDTHAHTQTGK
jgi:hypothetical protein